MGPTSKRPRCVRLRILSHFHLTCNDTQNLALQIVVSVLNSTKSTDVPTVLRSLSQDEQDTLMKYIYKGMGMPGWGDVSGSVLLGWHEKVCSCMSLGVLRAESSG